jgi:hypothetical protein
MFRHVRESAFEAEGSVRVRLLLALACCIALSVPCAWSAEPVLVVKIVDFDGKATFALKTRAELTALTAEIREEANVVPKALADARKEWEADPTRSGMRFPTDAIGVRQAVPVGTAFTDPQEAENKRIELESREFDQYWKRESRKNAAASEQKQAKEEEARALFAAHLTKLKQAPPPVAAPQAQAAAATTTAAATSSAPAGRLSIALLTLEPKAAEYGTLKNPESDQTDVGPGRIDTTPARNNNNATWFWPNALKIVKELPPDNYEFPQGQEYQSPMTDKFASSGFFLTGVGLWGRTRNGYHWIEYDIPQGATRFTADVRVTDDVVGWMRGRKDEMNQQFTFNVLVDGKELARQGATRLKQRQGSGERLNFVDVALPPGAQVIRFNLEVTPWGDGNKNIELVITDGLFR